MRSPDTRKITGHSWDLVRLSSHQAIEAESSGMSLNAWADETLTSVVKEGRAEFQRPKATGKPTRKAGRSLDGPQDG